METILKYAGLVLLGIAALGFTILSLNNGTVVMIPIDQSLCPPNLGVAPDGTCGIYSGRRMSGWSVACIVSGILGTISFVSGLVLARKNGS